MPRRKISALRPATLFESIQLATAAIIITLSVALILGQSAMALAAQKAAAVKQLTDDLLSLNAQHGKAANHLKPALLARLQILAAERHQQLAALIEADPGAVLNVALPSLLRQNMPARARNAIEEHVEMHGELEVLHEDRAQGSRFVYKLKAFGLDYSLNFKKNPPTHLNSGTRVKVRGVRVNTALALDSGASVQALAAIAPNTFGEQRTLVILVNFRNNTAQPYDVAYATNIFNTTSNFFLENSYGQTFLNTTVINWKTIDMDAPSGSCDYSQISSKADAKAVADGVTLSNYKRKVYAFPNSSGCGWWGLGTVGGNPSRAWINGSLQLRVAGHEMGHNLGLWHSHSLDCGAAVLGGTCTVGEYGDTVDIMGATANHFNAFQKERLGWLDYGTSPPITTAIGNGSYSLYPFETVGNNAKAVKILKYTNPTSGKRQYFYAECRRPLGFDANLSSSPNILNGFVIHTGDEASSDSSYLLDLTPETSSWNDPALIVGSSFTDSVSGVTLTPEVPCTNTLDGSINVSYGALACVRGAPDITISPTTNQTIAAGGSATYTLSVKNNDNFGCASASFNIARSVPSGWGSSLGSTSLVIAPGGTANSTLTLAAPAGSTDGIYNFSASATNAADAGYTDSISGAVVIYTITSINVALTTDRPSYTRRQNVTLTSSVSVNGAPASNVTVNLTMTKPNGAVNSMSAVTAANGVATYQFRIHKRDPLGTWQVHANGTVGGVIGSASKSFTVQ